MVLKDCPRCLVYTPKGEHLAEARVVHGEDGVSLYFDTYNMNAAKFSTRIDFYDEQKGLGYKIHEFDLLVFYPKHILLGLLGWIPFCYF